MFDALAGVRISIALALGICQLAMAQDQNQAAAAQPEWAALCKQTAESVEDKRVVARFEELFSKFLDSGKLDVGQSVEQVVSALGDSFTDSIDKTNKRQAPSQQRLVYGFMFIDFVDGKLSRVIDPRGLTEELLSGIESVAYDKDGGSWKARLHRVDSRSDFSDFYPSKQDRSDPIERRIVENYLDFTLQGKTVEDVLEAVKEEHARLGLSTNWKVPVEPKPARLFYVARSVAKDGSKRVEFGQILRGYKDIHRLAYISKLKQGNKERQAQWRKIVAEAKLFYHGEDHDLAERFFRQANELQASEIQGKEADKTRQNRVLRLLRQAVFHDDREAKYHFALCLALSDSEQLLSAWNELRKTVFLAPQHVEAAARFQQAWSNIVGKGLLDVGTSSKELRANLGTPDLVKKSEGGIQYTYGFMVVNLRKDRLVSWADVRGAEGNLFETDQIRHSLDPLKWSMRQRFANKYSATTKYTTASPQVAGASSDEHILMFRLRGARSRANAREYYQSIRDFASRRDKDREFKTLIDSGNNVIYETWQPQSKGEKKHQLTRVVLGESDIHCFTYQSDQKMMPADQRNAWLRMLSSIQLLPPEVSSKRVPQLNRRLAAWRLGSALAFRTVAPILKSSQKRQDDAFQQAQQAAKKLSLSIDVPPVPSGDIDDDVAVMSDYFNTTSAAVGARLGKEEAALFHLSKDLMLLVVKYHRTSNDLDAYRTSIAQHAATLGLPKSALQPLFDMLEKRVSSSALRRHVSKLQIDLEKILFKR